METSTLKIIFMVGFVVMYGLRAYYAKDKKQNVITKNKSNAQEKMLLMVVTIGIWILPLLYVFTPLFGFSDSELPL